MIKKFFKWIASILFAVAWLFISARYGSLVTIKDQMDIISSLRDVSAIIFGVMGAWLAIIYPKALKDVFNISIPSKDVLIEIRRIYYPIRVATLIVGSSLLYSLFYPMLLKAQIPSIIHPHIRGVSYFVIGAFVYSLIYSLLLSLLPMLSSELTIRDAHEARENHEEKMKNVQRLRTPSDPKR